MFGRNQKSSRYIYTKNEDFSSSFITFTGGDGVTGTYENDTFIVGFTANQAKKIYPIVKGSCLFVLDYLVERNGVLVTAPSNSPENAFYYYPFRLRGGRSKVWRENITPYCL